MCTGTGQSPAKQQEQGGEAAALQAPDPFIWRKPDPLGNYFSFITAIVMSRSSSCCKDFFM